MVVLAAISFSLFRAVVIMGMAGTVLLGMIIVVYTVYEARQREIW